MTRKLVVAVTGASGAVYGAVLTAELLKRPIEVHLIISDYGRKVMAHELHLSGPILSYLQAEFGLKPDPQASLIEHAPDNLFAQPASGSFRHSGMVICPCSMKTLAAIASGFADNLISRSADVCLKEKRPLVLLPRETPLSTIHLENLLRVAKAGAIIHPPVPAFYHRPETVRDIVDATIGRVLDHLDIPQQLSTEWNGQ
jgi:flavin prenyltransferase